MKSNYCLNKNDSNEMLFSLNIERRFSNDIQSRFHSQNKITIQCRLKNDITSRSN